MPPVTSWSQPSCWRRSGRMAGRRALLWSAAPALVLYGFHNWDLLVVAASVAGLWAWKRGKPGWAAFWFGVGTALKVYPLLFLVVLTIERWTGAKRRPALKALGIGLGTVVFINLPFALGSRSGWLATYKFHRIRLPNFDSLWGVAALVRGSGFWLSRRGELNFVSTLLIAGTVLLVLASAHRMSKEEGTYPFLQVCAALVATVLLWNKVQSPQYTLWLLPFFVLLKVNPLWWAAYSLVDVFVYLSVFQLAATNFVAAEPFVITAVVVRALLLLLLIAVLLRAAPVTLQAEPASVRRGT